MSERLLFDHSNPLRLKRQRIDEDFSEKNAEEELLEQDIEGNHRRKRHDKPRIDTTQYHEDSSDEDYEDNNVQKGKTEKSTSDSESDIFASDDEKEEEIKNKEQRKNSEIELLDMKKFEKENEVLEDHDKIKDLRSSDDNDEDDEDDEDEVKKDLDYYNDIEKEVTRRLPRNEPKLDAFNLKNEQKEGTFDANGNFIPAEHSDEDNEQQDFWLDGLKKADIKLAKEAEIKREQLTREQRLQKMNVDVEKTLFDLIGLLEPVESPLEALQRLNRQVVKPKSRKIKISEEATKKNNEIKQVVIQITDHCEILLEHGIKDVYSIEREELMLKYKEESGKQYKNRATTPREDQSKSQDHKRWVFRWKGDVTIHGPYSGEEMTYWKEHYFQNRVQVRQVDQQDFVDISVVTRFE